VALVLTTVTAATGWVTVRTALLLVMLPAVLETVTA
jgi:hypothetical protein